ncbi:MAG TPA: hypothetical protein VNF75_05165 [Candidatus Dormibacteraeota bacterium]|nr:hypothetical protein [Candidatus Dormibacteraeota bacterium]
MGNTAAQTLIPPTTTPSPLGIAIDAVGDGDGWVSELLAQPAAVSRTPIINATANVCSLNQVEMGMRLRVGRLLVNMSLVDTGQDRPSPTVTAVALGPRSASCRAELPDHVLRVQDLRCIRETSGLSAI